MEQQENILALNAVKHRQEEGLFKRGWVKIKNFRHRIAAILMGVLLLPHLYADSIPLEDRLQDIIDKHRQHFQDAEYFSGIQVSVKSGNLLRNFVSGTVAHGEKKRLLTPSHLFNIGSITKSFTAVLALQAEKNKQLRLSKPLKNYLPEYAHWGALSLEQLLNMTSGLPNYSDSPTMNRSFAHNLQQVWLPKQIIGLVYTPEFKPPLQTGYHYTNTGYILMEMILQQQTQKSYGTLLKDTIFTPLKLRNTFYPVPSVSKSMAQRLVSGYGFNMYTNPELIGRDVKRNNLSWAAAAGGIIANSEDVLHWVEAIFEGELLLDAAQKKKMQRIVSTHTGKVIQQTNTKNPRGFGLGIIESFRPEIGRFWYYEGQTLGYRALYMYVPTNKIIISALFNSATNGQNDHSGQLLESLYKALKAAKP